MSGSYQNFTRLTTPETPVVIEPLLPPQPNDGVNNERLGRAVEFRVGYLLLRQIPDITGISLTATNSPADWLGIDALVDLTPWRNVSQVFLQVKSTPAGMKRYRKHIGEKVLGVSGFAIPEAVGEWMKYNRMILVNGGFHKSASGDYRPIREDEIIDSFLCQLQEIENCSLTPLPRSLRAVPLLAAQLAIQMGNTTIAYV